MPHLYILKNKEGKHYIGMTDLQPEQRLERHNKGHIYSTLFNEKWETLAFVLYPIFQNLSGGSTTGEKD